jgi:hypothetical protein
VSVWRRAVGSGAPALRDGALVAVAIAAVIFAASERASLAAADRECRSAMGRSHGQTDQLG